MLGILCAMCSVVVLNWGWLFPLPQGTSDNVGSYFWLSQLERGLLPASSRQSLREAAKHPTVHRTVPMTENSPAQMSIVPRLQNSGLKSHRVTDKDSNHPDNGAEHWPSAPIDTIICTTGTIRTGMLVGGLMEDYYEVGNFASTISTLGGFSAGIAWMVEDRGCLKGNAENAGVSYLCSVSPEGHC